MRTEDIEQLYIFRFFISDLCKQLNREFQLVKDWGAIMTLYRGMCLSMLECEQIKQNKGHLISTNGFLSTSLDRDVAKTFADASSDTKRSALFQIECNFEETETLVLALISHLSTNSSEQEVLIDIGAIFKIVSVGEDTESNLFLVTLKSTDEGRRVVQEYVDINQEELKEKNVEIMWGDLLSDMGYHDKALQYFMKIVTLNEHRNDWQLQLHIGHVLQRKGLIDEARKLYFLANKLWKDQHPNETSVSIALHIANVLKKKDNYVDALQLYNFGVEYIDDLPPEKKDRLTYHDLATCFSNMGSCYESIGEYDQAIAYFNRAVYVRETHYMSDHVETAHDLHHIGTVYTLRRDYTRSLSYFWCASRIFEIVLPPDHRTLTRNHLSIVQVLRDLNKKEEATQCLLALFKTIKNKLPDSQLDLASFFDMIALYCEMVGDYDAALDYSSRSLEIMRKCLPPNDLDIVRTLTNQGNILRDRRNYEKAKESYREALTIYETIYPNGHPLAVTILYDMGFIYKTEDDLESALPYYEKARTIAMKYFPDDNLNIALPLSGIGEVHQSRGEYAVAVKYYEEVKTIREKYLHADHPDLLTIWMMLANINLLQGQIEEGLRYYAKVYSIEIEDIHNATLNIAFRLLTRNIKKTGECDLNDARESLDHAMLIFYKYHQYDLNDIFTILQTIINLSRKDATESFHSAPFSTRESCDNNEYVWTDIHCDSCHMKPLVGSRFKCQNQKCNYNLCHECFQNKHENNRHEHIFIELWSPTLTYSMEQMFDQSILIDKTGKRVPIESLRNKYIALYFSSYWSLLGREFTRELIEVYGKAYELNLPFDVVYISDDDTVEAFYKHYEEMPWKALAFADCVTKTQLKTYFSVSGIPILVILTPTCEVLTRSGVKDVHRTHLSAVQTWCKGEKVEYPKPNSEGFVWPSVTCDGCGMDPLIGQRFHCETCSNYDLCLTCAEKEHEHELVRVSSAVEDDRQALEDQLTFYFLPNLLKNLRI